MNIPPRARKRLVQTRRAALAQERREMLRDRVFTAVVVAVWVITIIVILRRVLP